MLAAHGPQVWVTMTDPVTRATASIPAGFGEVRWGLAGFGGAEDARWPASGGQEDKTSQVVQW